MGKRLAELEEDRDAGKPGAKQRLRTFRADNIILADAIVEVGYIVLSVHRYTNSSNRAALNLRNGPREKQLPKLMMLRKEETKDTRREYGNTRVTSYR